MKIVLGVAILRRSASIVQVESRGKAWSITMERRIERAPSATPGQVMQALLEGFTGHRNAVTLALALSPADLACGDAWMVPSELTRSAPSRVGSVLCESRCAFEILESLVADTLISESHSQAVALDRTTADEILSVAEGFKIGLMTAVPAALAQTFGTVALTHAGERFEVSTRDGQPAWRAYPVNGPDEPGSFAWRGQQIPSESAAAFAAATCDPERVPNLLNALPQHRKTFLKKFRDPLVNVAAAAALCFGALAVQFQRDVVREREELGAARRAEMELWGRFLPSEQPREARLLRSMRERLGDLGETAGAAEVPSALAFWGEIGKQMPDPEALGLTLESLDLAPDGGRMSARVPAAKEDPLKNAAQLESKLNQSKKMTTRGDYEVRDGQVQVRLRMDYKP